MRLEGKKALITGGSRGFGFAVAQAYRREGADVALLGREFPALQKAESDLKAIQSPGKIIIAAADVTDVGRMKSVVWTAMKSLGGLDILVSSAGVYGPKGTIEEVDFDEWWRAIRINLQGTVIPCRLVLPIFKERKGGTIILLSGGGATKPMPCMSAYAASKAAVVRFGETLAGEVKKYGVQVNCIAPGALNTRLLEEVLEAGPEKVGEDFYKASIKQKTEGGTPLERGAELCVRLATADGKGITGRLISAVWDAWEDLPALSKKIEGTDLLTLRRLTEASC